MCRGLVAAVLNHTKARCFRFDDFQYLTGDRGAARLASLAGERQKERGDMKNRGLSVFREGIAAPTGQENTSNIILHTEPQYRDYTALVVATDVNVLDYS